MPDIWTGREPETDSPYYPYRKVVDGNTMAGAEQLPYVLTRYIMDLPLPGYTPPSGNEYPRARIKKLLYWDDALPLEQPLPTTQQMKSIQFDPSHPGTEPDPKRGYRIFSQELVAQAQAVPQSIIRVYNGGLSRYQLKNEFVWRQQVIWTVMVHYALESNMGTTAASRSYLIAQAIIEATEGVNFGGVGSVITRQMTKFDDERTNAGYKIYQDIDWHGDGENPFFSA